jgi:hypothetical protein
MNRKLAISTAVALALGASRFANADAVWELNPKVEAGYLYDNNYRLTAPGTEISVSGPLVDAALEMRTLTQKGEFSFTPRVRATYFPGDSALDSVDYFATLDARRDGQRFRTRVRGDFAQQDIVNSEQPDSDIDTGLGEPVFGDAGRVLVTNRRTRFAIRPGISWDLSQRNVVELEAGYADVSFDRALSEAQVGFDTTDVAGAIRTRLNERTTIATRVRWAQYDIQFQDVTTAYGLEVQWDTRTVKDTRRFFRLGAQNVELPTGEKQTAWLAGAGVSVLLGRNEIFTDIARSVGPSSAGLVVSRDQLRLRLQRAMTPRLALQVGLRGTHDEAVDETTDFQVRSYATADVGLEWRWQEEWSFRIAGDYTWQKYGSIDQDADSLGGMVSIIYQPLQRVPGRND